MPYFQPLKIPNNIYISMKNRMKGLSKKLGIGIVVIIIIIIAAYLAMKGGV